MGAEFELFADAALGGDQRPHDGDGNERNNQAGQGGFWFVTGEQVEQGGDQQAGGQQVEAGAGDAQGGDLEGGAGGVRVALDSQRHGDDAQAGDDLDEAVDAETEQGEGFILHAKEDGNDTFHQVVEHGEDAQQQCGAVKAGFGV